MKKEVSIFWFRRDLRLQDNTGLYFALKENKNVLPVFIYDEEILDNLEDKKDKRVDFISQAIEILNHDLIQEGSALQVFKGFPLEVFKELSQSYSINSVYANHDYEPYARERDESVRKYLSDHKIEFKTYKDQVIFEKSEVVKADGNPYSIFTPYSIRWKQCLSQTKIQEFDLKKFISGFYKCSPTALPSLESIGFNKTDLHLKLPEIKKETLINYKNTRDFPSQNGTTRVSMHLRFGTISIRSLLKKALLASETWLNELIWREFYMMILWHFPHVTTNSFKKQYDAIKWRNNEAEFDKWCKGLTGFPIVDAGMRELNNTGFMHNRVRMIVSSFLVKDLLIDWRWGEAYFAQKLNDFDLSANNGGWQWAAGSGCDAAPYFRVFNPTEQQKKFDPEFKYIRKWISEFGTPLYPQPIVDHKLARLRALETYKKALRENF